MILSDEVCDFVRMRLGSSCQPLCICTLIHRTDKHCTLVSLSLPFSLPLSVILFLSFSLSLTLSLFLSFSLCLSLSHTHAHSFSLSLSLSHTHHLSLPLSLSLSHTHTHSLSLSHTLHHALCCDHLHILRPGEVSLSQA